MTGRFAALTDLQVAANLFHHAAEMLRSSSSSDAFQGEYLITRPSHEELQYVKVRAIASPPFWR
jgi:hypothetical protein